MARQVKTFCCDRIRSKKRERLIIDSEMLAVLLPGEGAIVTPHISVSIKMQNKKNTTFLALLRLFFLHWNVLKSDLKHLLRHWPTVFRGGANLSKTKLTNH